MIPPSDPGLGELLRYVSELVDSGAEEAYRGLRLTYRPRYTPILRALNAGARTVTEITIRSKLTQGAISQTVGLMEQDGLIERRGLDDGRKSSIHLTARGRRLLKKLEPHWAITFAAIEALENEINHPLRQALAETALALERISFAERLRSASGRSTSSGRGRARAK